MTEASSPCLGRAGEPSLATRLFGVTHMAAKKSVKPASDKPAETREHKFTRLANKRVNKVIQSLRLVGNLGSYPHSPEQAERIMSVIQQYVDALSVRIQPRTAKGKEEFEL